MLDSFCIHISTVTPVFLKLLKNIKTNPLLPLNICTEKSVFWDCLLVLNSFLKPCLGCQHSLENRQKQMIYLINFFYVYCDLFHVTDILWNSPSRALRISKNLMILLSIYHRLAVAESLQGMSDVTVLLCRIEDLDKLSIFVLTVSFVLELVQLSWRDWEEGALWKDGLYSLCSLAHDVYTHCMFPAFNVVCLFPTDYDNFTWSLFSDVFHCLIVQTCEFISYFCALTNSFWP